MLHLSEMRGKLQRLRAALAISRANPSATALLGCLSDATFSSFYSSCNGLREKALGWWASFDHGTLDWKIFLLCLLQWRLCWGSMNEAFLYINFWFFFSWLWNPAKCNYSKFYSAKYQLNSRAAFQHPLVLIDKEKEQQDCILIWHNFDFLMALHIAQLQECKVCSLLCSINEEKSCEGLLHLWRRDQSPVSTVWFVGSHKMIKSCTWIFARVFLPFPLVQQPWPEGSPWTLIPSFWEEAACRSNGRAPLIFLPMRLRLC